MLFYRPVLAEMSLPVMDLLATPCGLPGLEEADLLGHCNRAEAEQAAGHT